MTKLKHSFAAKLHNDFVDENFNRLSVSSVMSRWFLDELNQLGFLIHTYSTFQLTSHFGWNKISGPNISKHSILWHVHWVNVFGAFSDIQWNIWSNCSVCPYLGKTVAWWSVWGHGESGWSNAEHMVAEYVCSKQCPARLISASHRGGNLTCGNRGSMHGCHALALTFCTCR